MVKNVSLVCMLFFICGNSQVIGGETLSIRFTPSDAAGSYANQGSGSRYCIAVWIENENGTFVQTIGRWAGVRWYNLIEWTDQSGYDTDAISGATIIDSTGSFPQLSINNAEISLLPNAIYVIKMELTDSNHPGPEDNNIGTFSFDKNGDSSLRSGLSNGGFIRVTIHYAAGNEPGEIQFSSSSYAVSEDAGSIDIAVTRWGGTFGISSAMYATSNGSATEGEDYDAASGIIEFGSGDTVDKVVTVVVRTDSVVEDNETVNLVLSSFSGAHEGDPVSSVLTITNRKNSKSSNSSIGGCMYAKMRLSVTSGFSCAVFMWLAAVCAFILFREKFRYTVTDIGS